jgi:hypothetical protein
MNRSRHGDYGVNEYKAHIVGLEGHFAGYEPLFCADDSEAIDKAKRLLTGTGTILSFGTVPASSCDCDMSRSNLGDPWLASKG